ncbi:heavy metal-binding domain-containing protein [Thiomonas sp.]
MSFSDALRAKITGLPPSPSPAAPGADSAQRQARQQEWERALQAGRLPSFVQQRLADTQRGVQPWSSTASPAELLLMRSHGIRPLGMVMGNCWYHFGFSWTRGHYEGWHLALRRMQLEARTLGANAIVDVHMKVRKGEADDMDYAVTGTAIRVAELPASPTPLVATISALEFIRLLEDGMVPVGIAIGAHYDWYTAWYGDDQERLARYQPGTAYYNQEITDLSRFQESVRRRAIQELRQDGARMAASVLAHTQFTQMFRVERDDDNPERFLCRHIAIGTAIVHDPHTHPRQAIRPTLSLGERPLNATPSQKESLL